MTNGIVLRDVEKADLPILFEQQLDPVAVEMAAFPSKGREAFMAHWAKIAEDDTVITKVVLLDGEVAGHIVSFERSDVREVGYWVGRQYWGRGVATAGLAQFVAHDRTRPLYARVTTHNPASLRVLEKCGFTVTDDPIAPAFDDGVEELLLVLR